jgi:hypothetical protein
MAHDVFISHSTRDKPVSDAVCAALENAGIRCWVAPRDVQLGRSFAGEITRAIQHSKAMVLIFSANSNNSSQVLREVQLAVDSQLHILQFRIEEVLLNDDLKYYLSTPHWLDAMTPPLESHLDRLATSLKVLLKKPEAETAASIAPALEEQKRQQSSGSAAERQATPAPVELAPAKGPLQRFWIPGLVGALLLGGILLAFLVPRKPETTPTTTTAVPQTTPSLTAAPRPFERTWDFSAGTPRDVRSEGVEVVDAKIWKKSGGKHFRFLTGGKSWLEATFEVPSGAETPTLLTLWHLSSSPDGTTVGYSPVRISLNGSQIFGASPPESGWTEEQIPLKNAVQPGINTLRWDFLDRAETHYWLKSFRVSSEG